MEDLLDEQLKRLRQVQLGPAPPAAELLAQSRSQQERRIRVTWLGVFAVIAGTVVGLGIWRAETHNGASSARLTAGAGNSVPSSSVVTSTSWPSVVREPSDLSDALAAGFPSSFGGVVTTGPASVDVFAVGDATEVEAAARQLAEGRLAITMRPSDHTRQEILALKTRIEADRPDLMVDGVSVSGLGLRIEANGPRVLIGLSPDSATARRELVARYGADSITIISLGGVVQQ